MGSCVMQEEMKTPNEELIEHWKRIYSHQESDFRASSLIKFVTSRLKKGRVLDVGCGTGYVTVNCAKLGFETVGIDISEEMVRLTNTLAEFTLGKPSGKIAHVLGMEEVSKLGKRFDNVLCLDVIEHIKDDRYVFGHLHDALTQDGRLILSVPAIPWLYGKRDQMLGHFRRYSKSILRNLLEEQYFSTIELRSWNFIGVFPYVAFEKVLRRKVYEDMRYSKDGFLNAGLNRLLSAWFSLENAFVPPVGLSLILLCQLE